MVLCVLLAKSLRYVNLLCAVKLDYLQDLAHDPSFVWMPLDMNDQVNCFSDEGFDFPGSVRVRKAAAWMAAFSVVLLGGAIWAARVKHATGDLPAVGVLLVALGFAGCIWVIARAQDKLAPAALLLVMVQGLLGGLTVLYRLPTLVLVLHLGTSMLFLSAMTAIAWGRKLRGGPLLWITTAAVYFQILLGATVRHTGAGLVCTDLPYCRGAWWPTNVHPMVHLHMAHRAFAFVVLALVIWSSLRIARHASGLVRALAFAAPVLVAVQITLGVLTIMTFKDLVPLTAHLLVGALILADYVSLLSLEGTYGAPVAEPCPASGPPPSAALAAGRAPRAGAHSS